jgi:zinc/manganese transport system substrate-binding protein
MRILIFLLLLNISLFAQLNVVTSFGYIADLTMRIGGENVQVRTLANPNFDPHFIPPKPSFIGKLKQADLVIMNGAELEMGWLPPLLDRANNPKFAQLGLLDLSNYVTLIDIPTKLDRANGDVHTHGNPHFYLDPHNIIKAARSIAIRLGMLDPANRKVYRYNFAEFQQMWQGKMDEWEQRMTKLNLKNVIEYHPFFTYLFKNYNVNVLATIEPYAGIPPSASHLHKLITLTREQRVDRIVSNVFHQKDGAQFLHEKSGIKSVVLPHDVGSNEITDIVKLFERIIAQLEGY